MDNADHYYSWPPHCGRPANKIKHAAKPKTKCWLLERFASVWPELIIACDVREHGELLHRYSWPPLQLACAAYRLFAHAFHAF